MHRYPLSYEADRASRYAYLGGVEGFDVWAVSRRNPQLWDVELRYGIAYSYAYRFDLYVSSCSDIRSNQKSALTIAMGTVSWTDFNNSLLMVKCFAPHLMRGRLDPRIVKRYRRLEEGLTDA
jgi:hypothetical protein